MAQLKSTTINGTLSVTGQVTAESFNALSDRRLKENLVEFTPAGNILDLPVYKYDYIEGEKDKIGCMAQDLQKICPELVHETASGNLVIEEGKLVYLLLEEIKRLEKRVSELEGREF